MGLSRALPMAALVLAAMAAPAAHGQGPGVTVDPNSPAGKEYAIPIEKARRDAVGAGVTRTPSGQTPAPPTFGEGITPARAASRSSRPRSGGAGSHPASSSGSPTPGPSAAAEAATQRIAPSSSTSAWLLAGGGAVGVLLLAGALAGALRMASRRSA
jgi:hypothetical protein